VTPKNDLTEGETLTIVCEEGYEMGDGFRFRRDAPPFTATCIKDQAGGSANIEGVIYLGVYDKKLPVCHVLPPAASPPEPVHCVIPSIAHASVAPQNDLNEGGTLTIVCEEGFEIAFPSMADVAAQSPFTATCIKDPLIGSSNIGSVVYLGVYDKILPVCQLIPPAPLPSSHPWTHNPEGPTEDPFGFRRKARIMEEKKAKQRAIFDEWVKKLGDKQYVNAENRAIKVTKARPLVFQDEHKTLYSIFH
jgi:hypothetical protein